MNLIETPQSIVPGQSEIDCWPQLKRAMHPCQDKCSNFKDEECGHCLVKHEPVLQNADEAKHYSTYLEATRYAP